MTDATIEDLEQSLRALRNDNADLRERVAELTDGFRFLLNEYEGRGTDSVSARLRAVLDRGAVPSEETPQP